VWTLVLACGTNNPTKGNDPMQPVSRVVVGLVVLLSGLLGGEREGRTREMHEEEVVIMQCAAPGNPPQPYVVSVATSSKGAPTVDAGTNCADVVAGLLDAEFRLRQAVPGGQGNIIYTFIKH
jgi:hypothetical protein